MLHFNSPMLLASQLLSPFSLLPPEIAPRQFSQAYLLICKAVIIKCIWTEWCPPPQFHMLNPKPNISECKDI